MRSMVLFGQQPVRSATNLNEYAPTASLRFHQGSMKTCILGVVLHMLVDCFMFKELLLVPTLSVCCIGLAGVQ
jgi:hypothetical protein